MIENFGDYGYIGVFLALLAAGFGFPIPEELPVITAGVLVGHGEINLRWYYMLPLCIVGVVLGDCVLYYAGRIHVIKEVRGSPPTRMTPTPLSIQARS